MPSRKPNDGCSLGPLGKMYAIFNAERIHKRKRKHQILCSFYYFILNVFKDDNIKLLMRLRINLKQLQVNYKIYTMNTRA